MQSVLLSITSPHNHLIRYVCYLRRYVEEQTEAKRYRGEADQLDVREPHFSRTCLRVPHETH
jgi:hypothetical protein